jgi:hypothetical protein
VREVADEYLVDIDGQNREKEAIRRFCATPFLLDDLLARSVRELKFPLGAADR